MRTTTVLAAIGLIAGTITVTVVHFLSWSVPAAEATYHGRYVPLANPAISRAYTSTFSVNFDPPRVHPSWLPMLPVGAGVGLVVGALAGVVLIRVRAHLARPGSSDA